MPDMHAATVFLVGAGAEVNAWLPITKAISDVFPNAPIEAGNSDHANFFMAELIAVYRSIRALEAADQAVTSLIPSRLQSLRWQIASRLKEAIDAGDIRLRPYFTEVMRREEWGGSQVVVTTNWDTLIERDFPCSPVVHVHGKIEVPSSLFLPSDYAFDPAHGKETQLALLKVQDSAIKQLWGARTICIYGLSLDPLDNELAAIVRTGLGDGNSTLENVVIYNVERECKRMTDRLRLLLYNRQSPAPAPRVEFRAVPE